MLYMAVLLTVLGKAALISEYVRFILRSYAFLTDINWTASGRSTR